MYTLDDILDDSSKFKNGMLSTIREVSKPYDYGYDYV